MGSRPWLLALLCTALVAPGASAQVHLSAGVGVGVLVGSDFEGNEGGAALQFDAMVGPDAGLQYGGTFQWTSLGIKGSSESQRELEVLGAVRYLFQPDLAQLYLALRGGWVRKSFGAEDLTWTGFSAGPGVGLMLPFPGFGLELAIDTRYVSFGAPDVGPEATGPSPTEGASGFQLTNRIGVSIPVGR